METKPTAVRRVNDCCLQTQHPLEEKTIRKNKVPLKPNNILCILNLTENSCAGIYYFTIKDSCQFPSCDAMYVGETSKNLYTRDSQHQYNYTGGPNGNRKLHEKSFIFQHQANKHQGQEANFKRQVLRSYKDCLSRQASEAISISKIDGEIFNNKSEFHQPAIVTIRREVSRDL